MAEWHEITYPDKTLFTPADYAADLVFQRLQWEVRAAYEAGYTAANSDRGQSTINPKKGKWFDHWLNSKPRAFLIANNIITGEDDYR